MTDEDVDLKGKWIGFLRGKPVTLDVDGIIAVPCFDTADQCMAVMARAGVPSDVAPATIGTEEGFVRQLRDRMPGVKMIYNVVFGPAGGFTYHLLDIEVPLDPKKQN